MDRKLIIITVVSTLLIIIDFYNQFIPGWKGLDRTIIFFVVPMSIIVFGFREHPRRYGFQIGDWKLGLAMTAVALVVVLPAAWWLVRANETMGGHYRHLFGPALPAYVFLDLFGWEFMFRGWMVFGYTRQFGPQGIWLHCSLFALAHLGKPAIETFTTVAGGLAFGWIAYRTRSFLYPFLIHWALMTLVVMAAQTAAG